jgi:hypothetical protein
MSNSETEFRELLGDVLEAWADVDHYVDIASVRSFGAAGRSTDREGLVVRCCDGTEFTLTIEQTGYPDRARPEEAGCGCEGDGGVEATMVGELVPDPACGYCHEFGHQTAACPEAPFEETDTCPEHGEQPVIGHGSTRGSDPYAVSRLACGHGVICFGPGEANVIVERRGRPSRPTPEPRIAPRPGRGRRLPAGHARLQRRPRQRLGVRAVVSAPRYPEVEVKLIHTDGNAFAVLGRVRRELRRAGVTDAKIEEFFIEATAGDYDHLLRVCMEWVTVR